MLVIAGAFVLLPTIILAGAWRLGGASALEDDLLYYLPIRAYIGERVAAGEFPLWNPLVGMGTSIAADPQSGLWYPPTYLFAVLPARVAYPLNIILHFALAGWGMYRFLRASGRDWQAAFLGALAFEFCGFLVAHRVHLTMLQAVAWIPWILFGWRRFADTGRYRHFALASLAFGLQMLVQHTQISIMTAIIVTGYVMFMLLPVRTSLWWRYPLGMTLGAGIGAVQTLPTLAQLGASGRGVATFSTFVENSWVPSSAVMMLFPLFFGNRTPNLGTQPWWGLSHFCEQFAYGSIAVLVLSVASYSLLTASPRRRVAASSGPQQNEDSGQAVQREVRFWWAACGVALLIALGQLTPLSRLLFEVPVYRNLRVPARWILVWSLAMPILASAVITTLRQGGPAGERASRALRFAGTRVLPAAVLLCVLLVGVARWQVAALEAAYGQHWGVPAVLQGLRTAVRWDNPAIWWPLAVMVASIVVLLRWARRPDRRSPVPVIVVMLVDLASVAGVVDIDQNTYSCDQVSAAPSLVKAIRELQPQPGHRLLVPRYQADYHRPLEVLWPETNVRHGIETFNTYGPFWPKANRLLLRFMPWGSSEAMLELLRNRELCAALGVRFIAARTAEEHAIVAAARAPAVDAPPMAIAGTRDWCDVRAGTDLRWPVRVDVPGIYELQLQARPGADVASQWFVRLETPEFDQVGFARRLEPVDLCEGERTLRFLFVCPKPAGELFVRVKSERGHAVSVKDALFRQVAEIGPPDETAAESSGLELRTVTPDGVSLFECRQAVPLLRVVQTAHPVADVNSAVAWLWSQPPISPESEAIFEWKSDWGTPPQLASGGIVEWERKTAGQVEAKVNCQSDSLLVFNESFDPGWRAEVDGVPTRIHRVNAVVQGVIVPQGLSKVSFRYHPPGFVAGLLVSGFSLAVLAVGGFAKPRFIASRPAAEEKQASRSAGCR